MYKEKHKLSKEKEKCRDLVFKEFEKLSPPNRLKKILTLPSTNFILEKRLLETGKYTLTCCENNSQVYEKQLVSTEFKECRKIGKFNKFSKYSLVFSDVFQEINHPFRKYDGLFIDLCGALQINTVNKLLSIAQGHNLTDESIIAITTLRAREVGADKLIQFYHSRGIKDFRDNTFPKLIVDMAKSNNIKCKIVKNYNYINNGRPMKLYIFKLTKSN